MTYRGSFRIAIVNGKRVRCYALEDLGLWDEYLGHGHMSVHFYNKNNLSFYYAEFGSWHPLDILTKDQALDLIKKSYDLHKSKGYTKVLDDKVRYLNSKSDLHGIKLEVDLIA